MLQAHEHRRHTYILSRTRTHTLSSLFFHISYHIISYVFCIFIYFHCIPIEDKRGREDKKTGGMEIIYANKIPKYKKKRGREKERNLVL